MIYLTIISVTVAVASLAFSFVTYFTAVQHNKKQATLDAVRVLQNEVFDQLNVLTPAYIQEVARNNRSDEYKRISSYVARVEHFCVGLTCGIYDRKTFYKLTNGFFNDKTFLRRIEPIIDKKNKDSKHDYYENTHKVIKWMSDMSRKNK